MQTEDLSNFVLLITCAGQVLKYLLFGLVSCEDLIAALMRLAFCYFDM